MRKPLSRAVGFATLALALAGCQQPAETSASQVSQPTNNVTVPDYWPQIR